MTLVLDAALLACQPINFHPLVNTATTAVTREGLMTFLRALQIAPLVADFTTDPPTVAPL